MREESGKETFLVADIEELEKMDPSEIHTGRLNAKEVLTPKNGENYYMPDRRWKSKTIWRRSGSENIHLDPGQPRQMRRTRKSFRRIGRVFTTTSRLVGGSWWSKKCFLVRFRQFKLPSSRGTQSQTVRAERRIKTIIRISKETENYQMRGHVSHHS